MVSSLANSRESLLHDVFKYTLIICFFCQFLLQAFSYPLEAPRAALERLLHIDIAAQITPTKTTDHISPIPSHLKHHHHDTCTLCPLLSHFIFLNIALLSIYFLYKRAEKFFFCLLPPTRAPPKNLYQHPPTRAPPHPENTPSFRISFQVETPCLHILSNTQSTLPSYSL